MPRVRNCYTQSEARRHIKLSSAIKLAKFVRNCDRKVPRLALLAPKQKLRAFIVSPGVFTFVIPHSAYLLSCLHEDWVKVDLGANGPDLCRQGKPSNCEKESKGQKVPKVER